MALWARRLLPPAAGCRCPPTVALVYLGSWRHPGELRVAACATSEENAEHRFFADVLKKAQSLGPLPTAVVYPLSDVALLGAVEAAQIGLLQPVLIGPTTAIQTKADTLGLDLGLGLSHCSDKAVKP